jgi:predicted dithiol-disulfide oxidoreductase (DUF899 family)
LSRLHLPDRRSGRHGASYLRQNELRRIRKSTDIRISYLGPHPDWQNVRPLSTGVTTYNADYHTETNEQSQTPAINVFRKTDEGIFHTWSSEMFFAPSPDGMHPRHVDTIWPLWNVFDLTPDGRGFDWFPRNSYE